MDLLLTSSSFSSEEVEDIVRYEIVKNNYETAVIVTTPHPKKDKSHWNIETKRQMESFGLATSFIDFEKGEKIPEGIDVVYIGGGNTFTLLKHARDSNLKDILKGNGLYIGSSAGSVIMCPDIKIAEGSDENTVNLKDLNAFNEVDFYIFPHYEEIHESEVEKYNKEVVRLRNGMYILKKNNEIVIK